MEKSQEQFKQEKGEIIENVESKEKEPKISVLVVEDLKEHRKSAADFFSTHPEAKIEYAKNYHEATEKLEKERYDIILSDIFFPDEEEEPTKPNGLLVGKYALESKTPIVFVSDLNVHRDAHDILDELRFMFHRDDNILYPEEHDSWKVKKPWDLAFVTAIYLKTAIEKGIIIFGKSEKAFGGIRFNYEKLAEVFQNQGKESRIRDNKLELKMEGSWQQPNLDKYSVRKPYFCYENGEMNKEKVQNLMKENPIFKEVFEKYFQQVQ